MSKSSILSRVSSHSPRAYLSPYLGLPQLMMPSSNSVHESPLAFPLNFFSTVSFDMVTVQTPRTSCLAIPLRKRKVGLCSHPRRVCACAGVLEGRSSDRKLLEFGSVGRRSLRAIRIYLNRRRRLGLQTVIDSWTSCLNSCTFSSSNEDAMIVSLRVLIGRFLNRYFRYHMK